MSRPRGVFGRTPNGFTLLEVLVAVAILSVVATTLLVIRNNAISQSGEAYNLRVATTLAAQKMREIELNPNPTMALGAGEFKDYPGFTWDARATDVSFGKEISLEPAVAVKQITVTLTYPAAAAQKKKVEWIALIPPPVELTISEMSENNVPEELLQELQKAGIPFPGK